MERAEKMNMSLQAFHDSLAEDEKSRHVIYDNWTKFKDLEAAVTHFMAPQKSKFSLMQTLNAFIDENCDSPLDGIDCVKAVREAGHGACLDATVRIFFIRADPKKCLVWLWGEKNTGKTTWIDLLKAIFSAQEFNFKQSYCRMGDSDKDWHTQLYTSHEFDLKAAFNEHNFANLKAMWEGRGGEVSRNKFEKYSKEFTGGLFCIASNELPSFMDQSHGYYETQWKPFEARMELVHLTGAKDGNTKFPYNALTLACAIRHAIEQF